MRVISSVLGAAPFSKSTLKELWLPFLRTVLVFAKAEFLEPSA